MNTVFRTGTFSRLFRDISGIACLCAAAGLVSCEKQPDLGRSEYISVYADPAVPEPASSIFVNVQGGTEQLYVDTNIDFTVSWEDGETTPWIRVGEVSPADPQTGYRTVTLEVDRRTATGCYYTRRTGMLILSAADASLNYNCIISVHQGAVARVSSDFSFLRYGKTDPRFTDDETPIDDWTATQKNYGFTSTKAEGEDVAHCYGKNGYLKLGDDEGHGADIISPYSNSLRSDSLLMVSFRAVAYEDFYTGARDDNKVTVEVLGGGSIVDASGNRSTSIVLEAPYLDYSDEGFPDTMWNGTDFMVFVSGTVQDPVTADTRIRISCGSLTGTAETCSRIFIDNFYIRRLEAEEWERYFTGNGGSGKDTILGILPEEDQQ